MSVVDPAQGQLSNPSPQGSQPDNNDNASTTLPANELKVSQLPNKHAYENFIAAVLLTLSTAFCPAMGAIPLNYRTMLLPSNQWRQASGADDFDERNLSLVTFQAYLTTMGFLVVSLKVSQCGGLLPLDDMFIAGFTPPGQGILAAPFGIQAIYPPAQLGDMGTAALAQTPSTQALSLRGMSEANGEQWRQICLKILQIRGISPSILDGCAWVNISAPRRRLQEPRADTRRFKDSSMVTISWPAPLCFRSRVLGTSATDGLGSSMDSNEDSRDPLGDAGRWLHSSAERDDQISKRKADRSAPQPMEVDSGTAQPSNNPSGHAAAGLGRSAPGAAGTVYPTPPDGVPQPSGITPTFNGPAASPRIPSSGAAPVESEEQPTDSANQDSEMTWDQSENKEQPQPRDSNDALDEPDGMLMGPDMFGDNDITEDDFNFFDDGPENLDLDMTEFDHMETNSPEKPNDVKAEEEAQPADDGATPVPPAPMPAPAQAPVPTPVPTPAAAPATAPVPPTQDAEGFMKPELKHARSLLNDAPHGPPDSDKAPPVKRAPSPFDSETVFKRVQGSMSARQRDSANSPERKASVFEQIQFGPTLPLINQKYEKGGFFSFDQNFLADQRAAQHHGSLPETSYLKRHNKPNRRVKENGPPPGNLVRKLTGGDAAAPQASGALRTMGSPSDDDRSSVESDEDDSSYTSDDVTSPVKLTFKRTATNMDEDVASQATASYRDVDAVEETDQQLAIELPRLCKPESPEIRLSRLLLDPEPLTLQIPCTDEDMIATAQIVTEQAATGALKVCDDPEDGGHSVSRNLRQSLAANARSSLDVLRKSISPSLDKMVTTRLKGFLEVQDAALPGQSNRMQPRAIPGRDPNAEQLRPSNLYPIPSHHLEVRRGESKLSVLPTAVSFWENLGLGPASGAKDVQALCIFPNWSGMMDSCVTFVDRMKSLYELLRLGSFEKLALPDEIEAGMYPYEADAMSTSPDASATGLGSALADSFDALMNVASPASHPEINVVVLAVYNPSRPETMIEACLAFHRFIESSWKPRAKKMQSERQAVLQLVSSDMISSPTSLVVTPSSDLVKMCLEMYDRCAPGSGPDPSPAIMLEQVIPRIIDFKLTSTPSSSLMQENSCIHVAYAQSVDDRWVSAAWTDDRGRQQATASYCRGRKGRPLTTPMHEVAHEIWESTLEIISRCKVHWRVIITKSGIMEPHEIEFWADLARTESKASVAMVLMTVDTSPSLQLLPPVVHVKPSAVVQNLTSASFATASPVSTPQQSANILSPEQQANTPATPTAATTMTPGGSTGAADNDAGPNSDADAVLMDLTEQTWGAVVGHRLSNSSTPLELQPALVSGYLIKRTSISSEDPPVAMEVNLVHTEATARAYEPLLREMLSNFRGLGTLARARGVVDRESDVRPWHVAAAEKAVRALHMLM